MYECSLNGGPGASEVSIEVTGIPYALYAVYTYTPLVSPGTVSISDGNTTFYYEFGGTRIDTVAALVLTTSKNPLSPTSGPAQYQVFSGLSGSGFTLKTGGSVSGFISNNVAGLQIVELNSVPEPASALSMGLGAGWICLSVIRRRRIASGRTHGSLAGRG